jgi:hypothetical protein
MAVTAMMSALFLLYWRGRERGEITLLANHGLHRPLMRSLLRSMRSTPLVRSARDPSGTLKDPLSPTPANPKWNSSLLPLRTNSRPEREYPDAVVP